PMFHQFEGLLVDKGVAVMHLKGLFEHFVKEFFGPEREIRLRPHHFRFTEPSLEIDVSCGLCGGDGCRMCKRGWLELGGAGILHPDVLRAGGLDPDVYSALAFGWGVERTASMRAGINIADIRVMYKNDVRFLEQF
ncbi:MAG: phenylalanine--tRNA ligase subunit alpha, partial [Patescibacteria group bacterium]